MKRVLKAGLHHIGLLGAAEHIYFNLKTATPAVVLQEGVYRRRGCTSDGTPLPPAALIYDVIACRWCAVFVDSGREIVEDMAALLARHDKPLAACTAILDFGCGCGRLLRHLPAQTSAKLVGTDYNPRLIQWCQHNLAFAQFHTNELAPPFPLESASFDFLYARSVFTHLPLALQVAWMREIYRILQPGGLCYLTMHGRPLIGSLSPSQRATFEAGELVETYATVAGKNLCSTYANRAFVEKTLLEGFRLADFVEGRPTPHLRQDIYLLEKV